MPPVRTGAPTSSSAASTGAAAAVQTAFRDVTNSYLNANKENIPPGFTGGGGGHPCGAGPNSTGKSRGPVPRDSAYCGTPVQGELRPTSEAVSTTEARLGYTPSRGGAAQTAEGATVAATAAATRVAQLPLTPQGHRTLGRYNGISAVADLSPASASDDSELTGSGGVARTPGPHRSHYAPAAAAAATMLGNMSTNLNGSNTSVACRLMQQQQRQQRGASQPQIPDSATLLAAATPNQTRQRPSRVSRAALLSSPLYTPSGGPGFATSARLGCAAEGNNGTGAPLLTLQPSPMCTPKGARRSAALAAAAAAASGGGARPPYETPTRLEELSLFFNNSFESGSESPCGDAGAGMAAALSGYAAGMEAMSSSSSAAAAAGAELTPTHTYDIQAAVEEMLRGCLDGSSPGKASDASGTTPLGARRRQWQQQRQLQQQQHGTAPATPFNVNAALEALLPTATMPSGAEFDVWAPMAGAVAGAPGCTPERLTAPQGAFAESDEDEAMTTPQSDRASRGAPAAGVRRDPLVCFSTAAMPVVGDGSVRQVGADAEASPRAGSTATAESLSRHSSDVRSGFEYHCREGSGSGPDVLAMLAAAVQQHQQSRQQQQQPSPPHGLDTQPQSARSTLGSAELDVHHHAEYDGHAELSRELISSQSATAVPPSYGAPARGSAAGVAHHVTADPAQPPSSAALPAAAAAAARVPAPRRSHHLPQVKAAAGSLIAVGGRRVPVNKLHLLAIGDEPAAGAAASSSPSAAAGGAKATSAAARGAATSSQAAAAHHVEGPSMRRMPKPSLVTVTRTPSCGNDERVSVVSGTRSRTISSPVPGPAGQPSQTSSARPARVPASASHTSLADDAPRPVSSAVPGPFARRVPPALAAQHLQQRHCGSVGAAAATMSSSSPAAGESGAQQQHSSEADVVAVLQFSKGQRMRFLTNLSPAALAAAKGLVAREGGSGGAKRASSSAGGGITTSALSSRTLPTRVEVGKSYLAHVYASESPYDGVAYEDVGVCVELVVPSMTSPSAYTAHLSRVDGLLLRLVDVFGNDEDRRQHERALMQQTTAYIECERQFKFSSLPFQLESIYCTFDGSVCVVLYSVVGGTDRAAAASHRHPNTSRVVRELQFHLDCRVFLKRC